MFIIFGMRGITSSSGSGTFFCPNCGETHYVQKSVRRFFTLFFIPLIPLNKVAEYVECQRCRGTYKNEALNYNPRVEAEKASKKFAAEFETAIKRVLVQMCLADGVVADEEIELIGKIYQTVTQRDFPRAEIDVEIQHSSENQDNVLNTLHEMSPYLNPEGKEMVFKASYFMAFADGEFHETETEFLAKIATAMEITSAHLKGMLQELSESSESNTPEPVGVGD